MQPKFPSTIMLKILYAFTGNDSSNQQKQLPTVHDQSQPQAVRVEPLYETYIYNPSVPNLVMINSGTSTAVGYYTPVVTVVAPQVIPYGGYGYGGYGGGYIYGEDYHYNQRLGWAIFWVICILFVIPFIVIVLVSAARSAAH